jgi:DNA-binding NarL/FixJ family response regulator
MAGKEDLSMSWKRPKTSPSLTASPPADPVIGCGVDRVVSAKRLRQHELAILGLLNLGMTNQEIANELAITVTAIKWRVSHIFWKLQVRNRIEAAAHTRLQLGLSETGAELPQAGPLPEQLFKIEIAILRLVSLGMTTQEIASNLNLTVGTVKWRISQIFGKLQVRNRIQALARARQRKWL